MDIDSVTEIKPAEADAGFDVYAARRMRGEQVPEFAGDQLLEVRSYEDKSEGGRVEMAGAQCVVKASNFSADVTTPGKVRLPLYRRQSSTLSVSCSKPGYKPRMVETTPYDWTRKGRYGDAARGGVVGVAVTAAFDAMTDNSKNHWLYPPVAVVLEKATAAP